MKRIPLVLLAVVVTLGSLDHAFAADALTVTEADRLVLQDDSRDREKALRGWSRNATLPELMFVLRHDAAQLGSVEATLVEEALSRTSDVRPDLRRRLRLRLALANPQKAKKMLGESRADVAALDPRARASAYRLAVLLPEEARTCRSAKPFCWAFVLR